jgi:hypothetical protein
MRRKLIKQEAFDEIASSSVTAAERELVEAEDVLARALGKNQLSLHSFNGSVVMYESLDDTYVHAGYDIKDNNVTFNSIEELVVDHNSKIAKRKNILGEMIDAVLVDDESKANQLFNEYMGLYSFNEAKKTKITEKETDGKFKFGATDVEDKPKKTGKFPDKMNPFEKKAAKKSRDETKDFNKSSRGINKKKKKDAFIKTLEASGKKLGKKIKEAYEVADHVLDYVDYMRVGPALSEAVTQTDDNGNIVNLRIPTSHLRNEGRILASNWKTLNSQVKSLRETALGLHADHTFAKAMSDLKRQNAFSDAHGLQEVLENIVQAWPQVLYVSQGELTHMIGQSLTFSGAENYDDQTCAFMAEGILRTAHTAYQERANQILHLANATKRNENTDPYDHFQEVAELFFANVDEKFSLEKKIFSDLYESLEYFYQIADRRGNNDLKRVTAGYLNELADVLNGKSRPEIELAEEVAEFVVSLVETNLDGIETWKVSNDAHVTVSGDHPDMEKKAKVKYAPADDFDGDWGDEAPMIGQDSMTYKGGKFSKEARNKSWGNEAGKDTFPTLKNPYIPKPFGDYTMKGEKGVDKDTPGGNYWTGGSEDLWPKLQNPYVPKAETNKTYKMNKGKEKDLIIDK